MACFHRGNLGVAHTPISMSTATVSARTAYATLAVVIVSWGLMWTVSKLLLLYLTPLWATALRTVVGAAALLVISLLRGRLVWPVRGDLVPILSISLLHMCVFSILTHIGLQYVSAGRTVVLAYTTPLWVVPAAWYFLGERISRARAIGLLLGLTGLACIFNPVSFDWSDRQALFGNGLILLGAMCWAANIVIIRAHRWVTPPFELTFWQALLATVLLSMLAWSTDGLPEPAWDWELVALLAYGGIVGTAVGYWAMVIVNRALPASATSLGLLAVPVVGLLISKVVLNEAMDSGLLVGTVLIIGGIALDTLNWGRRPSRDGGQ